MWEYRVVEFRDPDGVPFRSICDVFIVEGQPTEIDEGIYLSIEPDERGEFDFSKALEALSEAIKKPVLTEQDFKG